MSEIKQGDFIIVDLDPSKGTETRKTRPCLVVSNDHYNQLLNTIVVAPISSSAKYNEKRFRISPFFVPIPKDKKIKGTILLQHIRSIDPKARVLGPPIDHIDSDLIDEIRKTIEHFF